MKPLTILLFSAFLMSSCGTNKVEIQSTPPPPPPAPEANVRASSEDKKPKLVIGITVDQMRYDYLTRYWDDYGNGGFKRLMGEGFNFKDTHYSYAPTYTGPGHACIYTGTTPGYNGIIANDWYSRSEGRTIYCAEDSDVTGVGYFGPGSQMSPKNLKSSTIGDQLKLASNFRSKVIGISLKDRGAILPAGKAADAAYWFIGADLGHWCSSNYYMSELPQWVRNYNQSTSAEEMLASNWELLRDEDTYNESTTDNTPYEAPFNGTLNPTFPYNLSELSQKNGFFDLLRATPFGNDLVADLAKEAILNEALGKDEHPDLLAISFSSPDFIGHQFGPQSMEAQDIFLRLDLVIEELLVFLDQTVGKDEYIVFLTADHGAAYAPSYLQSKNMNIDYWNSAQMIENIEERLSSEYGTGKYIEKYSNDQIFLNNALLSRKQIDRDQLNDLIIEEAIAVEGVAKVIPKSLLLSSNFKDPILKNLQMGCSQKLSGDLIILLEPGWITYGPRGTTHGSAYPYDTHVPFVLFGTGVSHGMSSERTEVVDIAPTVCSILGIQMPNACIGKNLETTVNP